MKKILLMFIIILNIFTLSSCGKKSIAPNKVLLDEMDVCVAFGTEKFKDRKTNIQDVHDLSSSDILLRDDLLTLHEYDGPVFREMKKILNVSVYLGIDDGKDYIYIQYLDTGKVFKFESDLHFSFTSVIEKFEELSGTKLTKEFLNSNKTDFFKTKLCEGIFLKYELLESGNSRRYFKSTINEKEYEVEFYGELPIKMPEVDETPEKVYLDVSKTMNPIEKYYYKWYVFEVPKTCEYYFLFRGDKKSNNNRRIELFKEQVSGYSYKGVIKSNQGTYISEYNEEDEGSYFRITLNEGDTIYIRLSGVDFKNISKGSLFKISTNPDAFAKHVHTYENCVVYDENNHQYICDCNEEILEAHTSEEECTICGFKNE